MTPTYKIDTHLIEALRDVSDPELPLSLVDMGLVYGVWLEDGVAYVKLTYTSMGCPCAEFIVEDVRELAVIVEQETDLLGQQQLKESLNVEPLTGTERAEPTT